MTQCPIELYLKLKQMASSGSSHDSLVQTLRYAKHNGYDESDDRTMIMAYFPNGVAIVISPYHQVGIFTRSYH